MTIITIEYVSENFRSKMFEELDKILDVTPNCKITIDFTRKIKIE